MIQPAITGDASTRWGAWAVVFAAGAFGSGPVIASMITLSVDAIVFYRFVGTTLVLLALVALWRRPPKWRVWARCAPAGCLLAVQIALFFEAARVSGVANATLIMSLQPILVVVVGPKLLHERISRQAAIAAVASIVGVALVVMGGQDDRGLSPLGIVLCFSNLIVWTAYVLVAKTVRSGLHPIPAIDFQIGVNLAGTVLVAGWCLVSRPDLIVTSWSDGLGIAAIVVVTGILGHLSTTWAQRYVPQLLVSTLLLLQPVMAMIGAALLLDQIPSIASLAGGAVVLGSAVAAIRINTIRKVTS